MKYVAPRVAIRQAVLTGDRIASGTEGPPRSAS